MDEYSNNLYLLGVINRQTRPLQVNAFLRPTRPAFLSGLVSLGSKVSTTTKVSTTVELSTHAAYLWPCIVVKKHTHRLLQMLLSTLTMYHKHSK